MLPVAPDHLSTRALMALLDPACDGPARRSRSTFPQLCRHQLCVGGLCGLCGIWRSMGFTQHGGLAAIPISTANATTHWSYGCNLRLSDDADSRRSTDSYDTNGTTTSVDKCDSSPTIDLYLHPYGRPLLSAPTASCTTTHAPWGTFGWTRASTTAE